MPMDKALGGNTWANWEKKLTPKDNLSEYAKHAIQQKLEQIIPCDFLIKVKGTSVDLYIPESYKWRIIGKGWSAINDLEKTIGLNINVKSFEDLPLLDAKVDISEARWDLHIAFPQEFIQKTMHLLIGEEIINVPADSNAVATIKNKPLLKSIQKRWFVIIDTDKL